ncbi:MAG: hypothetical protein F3745_05215, partial [Nitrospinae bacterium]|nr:hypothetical protein [Nitrospinota bacterium]
MFRSVICFIVSAVVFIIVGVLPAQAAELTVFGPEEIVKENRRPQTITKTFSVSQAGSGFVYVSKDSSPVYGPPRGR